MASYFKVLYDNQAGSFTGEGTPGFTELEWPGSGGGNRGQIIQDFDDGATGKLHVALISGSLPTDGQQLFQGAGNTADANGAATTLLYPAYFRLDVDVTDNGSLKDVRWDSAGGAPDPDGNGVIPTHSLYFDGQTVDLTLGQTLTFSGGQTAELVRIIDQTGLEMDMSDFGKL